MGIHLVEYTLINPSHARMGARISRVLPGCMEVQPYEVLGKDNPIFPCGHPHNGKRNSRCDGDAAQSKAGGCGRAFGGRVRGDQRPAVP